MNKKKSILLITIVSIIIIVILVVIFINNNKEKILIEGQKLNESYIEIFEVDNNQKVYTQIPNIKYLDKNNKEFSLEKALKDNVITIDYIISKSVKFDELNDGGTRVYYFDNKFANKSFEIVKCNTIDGVKDIYIVENVDLTNTICVNR